MRKLVAGFSVLARPLHHLTKNNVPFVWVPEQEQSFCKLKERLVSGPVLRAPDFSRSFHI